MQDWKPKIADFGLCISENSERTFGVGSSSYMAPECMTGNYTTAVDIFRLSLRFEHNGLSLGITIFELFLSINVCEHTRKLLTWEFSKVRPFLIFLSEQRALSPRIYEGITARYEQKNEEIR